MEELSALLASAGIWPYVVLFALAAGESSAFVGLVVPGETFVIAAGIGVSSGALEAVWVIVAVVAGAIAGDNIGYAIGSRLGDAGCARRFSRWSPVSRRRVRTFFARRGPAAVFWGRFVGLLRPLVPFAAGIGRMPYGSFFAFNVAGAVVWGTATVLIGVFLGSNAHRMVDSIGAGAAVIALVAVVAGLLERRVRRRGGPVTPVAEPDC